VKDATFAKFVLIVNGAVPAAMLGWDAYNRQLGANPTNNALLTTGLVALIFLLLSLTITPARKLTGYNFLSNFRRILGLYAFFYATLHFGIYFVLERRLDVEDAIHDILYSRRNMMGLIALALMVPLAATSTNESVKRMGAVRWKRLHKLAYVSAGAGVVHFLWAGKDHSTSKLFALILVVLLGYRAVAPLLKSFGSRSPRPTS
jgi:sulfoxide reductase heme-binding subunit YedZ